MVMSSEDITNYQRSDNYNKVILEEFTEYSALWITVNDGNRSQMSFYFYNYNLAGDLSFWEDAGILIVKTQVFFRQKDNCWYFLNFHDLNLLRRTIFYDKFQGEKEISSSEDEAIAYCLQVDFSCEIQTWND